MKKTLQAKEFFEAIYNSMCQKICIENPVGYMNTNFKKATQIIEPFHFGHPERKKTCLWLKGLPQLIHQTNLEVKPIKSVIRKTGPRAGQPYNYYWREGKNAMERSKTFPGIAAAMADQWG